MLYPSLALFTKPFESTVTVSFPSKSSALSSEYPASITSLQLSSSDSKSI